MAARIRTIKPEFFTSEDIVGLSFPARLLYVALWCEADREGRLEWKPLTFKMRYFPVDDVDCFGLCNELLERGLVVSYAEDTLAFIPTFKEHQNVNPRESASKLPAPTEELTRQHACSNSVDASRRVSTRGLNPSTREHACSESLHAQPTGAEIESTPSGEGKGREGKENIAQSALALHADAAPPVQASPIVATIPCVGDGPDHFDVTQAEVDEWQVAYPGIDVLGEVRKARVWCEANRAKRKTHRGVPKFLVSWLGRAQDSGRQRGPRTQPDMFTVPTGPAISSADDIVDPYEEQERLERERREGKVAA